MAERRVENERLAYYSNAADDRFWDRYWKAHLFRENYARAERGVLGWFEQPFSNYLPNQGHILEAGCGLGRYVVALRVRGYDVEGVEWGSATVKAVRTLFPDLPIRTGDVTQLSVPDSYYSGYISLGVVEHRREGPEPFLKEACRVLKPGGVAFISVPYIHPLRRIKARLGLYRGQTDRLDFYQYAFTKEEFAAFLRHAGFSVMDQSLYDGFKGLKDEIPILRRMLGWRGLGWRLSNLLHSWNWAQHNLGHMILFVCRKEAT